MFIILAEIFLLGLIGGAVPGPILTAVFTEIIRVGFRKSLKIISYALLAEVVIASIVISGVHSLNLPESYFHILSFFGALVLFWLAYKVWKIGGIDSTSTPLFSLPKIFLLTVLNGGFWIFWTTICIPRAFNLAEMVSGGQFLFLLLFEFGWLSSTVLLAYIFSYFRPILQKKSLVSSVFKVFAILLVLFALKSIFEGIVYFFM